jgi:hypothetical protein
MQRAARALGPGRMRVLGGLGGLVACGVAGVTVAASPKPAGAPLQPPVDPHAPLSGVAHPSASAGGGLVIPATPVCDVAGRGAAAAGTSVDPTLQPILMQLRAAKTRAERMSILQGLTADQRQQLTALLRNRARGARCTPAPAGAAATDQQPMVEPDVVAGGASPAPVTSSYVS